MKFVTALQLVIGTLMLWCFLAGITLPREVTGPAAVWLWIVWLVRVVPAIRLR